MARSQLVMAVRQDDSRWKVLEVFAGFAELTHQAQRGGRWGTLQPFDLEYGDDLLVAEVRAAVLKVVDEEEPDLVVLEPPCGPWSNLQNLSADPEALALKREAHRPLREPYDALLNDWPSSSD